jgi:hypothetical protein
MDRDNVTSLEAHKIADLMMQEWLSAYSDNGHLWDRDYGALQLAKKDVSQEVIDEAYQLANARWKKMHNHD